MKFTSFCQLIAREADVKLQHIYTRKHGEEWYLPDYRLYIGKPGKYGWAGIRFQPTRANLRFLQERLHLFFSSKLDGVVSLTRIELAYDFSTEGFNHDEYCALALRLGRSIWPIHGTNTYVTAIVGQPKRVRFGEKNGGCTVYVQGCPKSKRYMDSDELEHNPKAAMQTKIYAKSMIAAEWFMRIEATLNKAKALHMGIKLNLNNFTELLDCTKELPFSRFWEFRNINIEKFTAKLCQKPSIKNVRRFLWAKKLKENINAPVADQTRLMRCAANGKKGLSKQIDNVTRKITFADVANEPLPDGFTVSQRMGRGKLPDNSELGQVGLVGIWNKPGKSKKRGRAIQGKLFEASEAAGSKKAWAISAEPLPDGCLTNEAKPAALPIQAPTEQPLPNAGRGDDSPPLPALPCGCACLPEAGIPKNRAELPLRWAKTKNPTLGKGASNFGSRRPASGLVARCGDPPCRVRPPP